MLKAHEYFKINRRRKKLPQWKVAKLCNTSQTKVSSWENGYLPLPNCELIASFIKPVTLTDGEWCRYYRSKWGFTIEQAAQLYGKSRISILHYESDKRADEKYLIWLKKKKGGLTFTQRHANIMIER